MKHLIIAGALALAMTAPVRADTQGAGTLLAITTYVRAHCPRYAVDFVKMKETMSALGEVMEPGSGPSGELLFAAAGVTVKLEKDKPDNVCPRIWDQFGTGGETFPGIVIRK